jgi:hypothetical protein
MSCDCPICFDPITTINCTTTECGHTFHSFCIFKNLSQTNACPLCRKELVEVVESSDDEDEEEDIGDDSSEEDEEEGEEETTSITSSVSILQITEALKRKGFTELDFIRLILTEFYDFESNEDMQKKDENLLQVIDSIFTGNLSVDHRDKRSYLDVLLGKEKCGETGIGPKPVEYKKVNFVV